MTSPEVETQFYPSNIGPERCAGTLFFTPEEAELFERALQSEPCQDLDLAIECLTTDEDQEKFAKVSLWEETVKEGVVAQDVVDGFIEPIHQLTHKANLLGEAKRQTESNFARGKTSVYRYVTDADKKTLQLVLDEFDRLLEIQRALLLPRALGSKATGVYVLPATGLL